MSYIKLEYTLHIYGFATAIKIDEIHTEGMFKHDVLNRALQIVDTAKAKGQLLEIIINRLEDKKMIGKVTPDEIFI